MGPNEKIKRGQIKLTNAQEMVRCERRHVIKAGTSVRVVKEITLKTDRLNVTFAHVKVGATEGWVVADALN